MPNHITINDQLPHGRKLRAAMNKMDEGLAEFAEILDIAETMREADGSVGTYLQGKFGFSDPKSAADGIALLAALREKFSPVLTDMIQAFRKFG